MIRSNDSQWSCRVCGQPAVQSCGHGEPLCVDCPPTDACGACVVEQREGEPPTVTQWCPACAGEGCADCLGTGTVTAEAVGSA